MSLPEQRCFLVSKDVVVPLSTQQPVVLGRDPVAANFLLSDDRVSRVHAMILFRDGQYLVKDLNSSNGTFVNGRRVVGVIPLKPGDRIGISPFSLEFVQPQLPAADSITAGRADGRNKFEGSIATLPVADLIQLLNATQQSGTLSVVDTEEKRADLTFLDGEIVEARYDGLQGEAAVYNLMRARRGSFEFVKSERPFAPIRPAVPPGAPEAAQTIAGDRQIMRRTQSLLLEGARLMDEAGRPDTTGLHANGATTRDSSTARDFHPFGNLIN